MKRWLLVVPVIAVALFFALRSSQSKISGKLFPDFRPDDVSSILISASENHVTLIRRTDGWTVLERDHFPADSSRITQVLRQTWDMIPIQEIPAQSAQLDRFQLADPGSGVPPNKKAMQVSFVDKNQKPQAVLLLGKRQAREGKDGLPGQVFGRFVIPSGHRGSVYLTKELFHEVLPSPMAWLDTGFPKIPQPQSFEYHAAKEGWKVVLEDGRWNLSEAKDNELIDPNKLYSLLTQWATPSFFDVATASDSPDFTQAVQITIRDLNGESVTYEIGKSTGTASPVKVRLGESKPNRWKDRIFWVDSRLVDGIPTTRDGFLAVAPAQQETKSPGKL